MEVPMHLRNAPVKAMKEKHGYHVGYQYPHNQKDAVVHADYFPMNYSGPRELYVPNDRGFEAEVRERLEAVKQVLRS
jgi:putative ATPase